MKQGDTSEDRLLGSLRFSWASCVRTKSMLPRAMPPPMVFTGLAALAFAMGLGMLPAHSNEPRASRPRLLTSAASVLALEEADARLGLPVRLRGIVMIDASTIAGRTSLYLSETGAGIYLSGDSHVCGFLRRGEVVEIQGRTVAGLFNPYVWCESVIQEGFAPIPEPIPVGVDELAFGRKVNQWIRVRGIIRRVEPMPSGPESWRFEMVSGGGRLTGMMRNPAADPPPVDAEVEVSAICSGRFDKSRQWLGAHLIVPGGVPIKAIKPSPMEPPLRPMDRLMSFRLDDSNAHRVRVRGVVTHCVPGEGFWMQDGDHGLQVITGSDVHLIPGEPVEALGFAAHGKYSPVLEDVTVTRLNGKRPMPPRKLDKAMDALQHDDKLVRLEGVVINQKPTPEGAWITLADGRTQFDVQIDQLSGINPKTVWPIGSKLRATGICVVTDVAPATVIDNFTPGSFAAPGGKRRGGRDRDFGPQQPWAFKLLARSPADLALIAPPPWWTSSRIAWLLGLISLGLLLGIGTVVLLARHRLRQSSTARQQAEAEFAAIWGERNRIAREIHDTLAQALGAASLHLELVKDHLAPDSEASQNLAEASRLTRESLAETRNTIWKMRSQSLETGDLASALTDVLNRLTAIKDVKGSFNLSGKPYRLPPLMENNLLRIGQEAITNAVKHSQARNVMVNLSFMPGKLYLKIADDGRGFDPQTAKPREKNFGLVGIHERAREIHADLNVKSSPDRGTEVTVELRQSHMTPAAKTGQ